MKKILPFLLLLVACTKEVKQESQAQIEYKPIICDIPLVPDSLKGKSLNDTTLYPITGTTYGVEVNQPQGWLPPIAMIFVENRSTRISSPYWNGGVPFTTKQVVTDTNKLKLYVSFANHLYGSWRIEFTRDSARFADFVGYKDKIHLVSIKILSDGATTESQLIGYASGVAFINGLYSDQLNDGFVFADVFPNTRSKYRDIASIIAHESGHMIGLVHQSEYDANCAKINEYRPGTIMGNPFYPYANQWYVGPSARGCTIIQNDTANLTYYLGRKI